MRHYEVVSPEMCDYSMYEPSEPFLCWGLYLARNKRDAIKQAVADPAFDEWVREARGDRVPPFKGLKATLAICSHGCCWGCAVVSVLGCVTCCSVMGSDPWCLRIRYCRAVTYPGLGTSLRA